jgi:hypothetical protein
MSSAAALRTDFVRVIRSGIEMGEDANNNKWQR